MTYTQFGSDYLIPEALLNALGDGGWSDESYGNDCGPSFDFGVVKLMVLQTDPLYREDTSANRFLFMPIDYDGLTTDSPYILTTNDVAIAARTVEVLSMSKSTCVNCLRTTLQTLGLIT